LAFALKEENQKFNQQRTWALETAAKLSISAEIQDREIIQANLLKNNGERS